MDNFTIGVIGGSGLYNLDGLQNLREIPTETPFGEPSAPIIEGFLEGTRLLFIPRHGHGHRFLPHEVNYRANIYALKKQKADCIIAFSAVGSMREEIAPGHILIPDQFIDRTYRRINTFFGDGVVAHVQFGTPICTNLAEVLYQSAVEAGATVHKGGTYICIEGPQFSSRAESELYRSWGVSVIGMTNATEAKLAREAELPFATVALVTDYDCWHESEEEVSAESVLQILKQNASTAQKLLKIAVKKLAESGLNSDAYSALEGALMTPPEKIPPERREELQPLLEKYLK